MAMADVAIRKVPQASAFSNPALDNIYARRSIRKFTGQDVAEEVVYEILRAGTFAPSGGNRQPWRFVVVRNREKVQRLGKRARQLFVEYTKPPCQPQTEGVWADLAQDPEMDFFYGAPLLVLVFQSREGITPVRDCSLAAENMMLAASSMGLGSCFAGTGLSLSLDRDFLNEARVPPDHKLVAPLVFGYSAENELTAPSRKDDVILNWID
jgi:nitroreductase